MHGLQGSHLATPFSAMNTAETKRYGDELAVKTVINYTLSVLHLEIDLHSTAANVDRYQFVALSHHSCLVGIITLVFTNPQPCGPQ